MTNPDFDVTADLGSRRTREGRKGRGVFKIMKPSHS
jgi:hypothetical protein